MNAKALGGGAVVLIGIGGFLVYNYVSERREARKRQEAVAADRAAETAKKEAQAERTKHDPTWATIPDLTGKTEVEAKKLLTEAGFQQVEMEVMEPRYECVYDKVVHAPSDMVPVDTICNQDPEPGGRVRAEKFAIQVVIEHDTFERGGLATSEWRRMPDVLGMSLTEAQGLLASKGFGADEFEVEDYTHSCPSMKVCETVPPAGNRKRKDTPGIIRASMK